MQVSLAIRLPATVAFILKVVIQEIAVRGSNPSVNVASLTIDWNTISYRYTQALFLLTCLMRNFKLQMKRTKTGYENFKQEFQKTLKYRKKEVLRSHRGVH